MVFEAGKYLFNIKKNDGVGIDEDLWHEYMLIKGMLNKFDWTVSSGKIGSEENIDFEKKKLINNIDKRYGKNLRTGQQCCHNRTYGFGKNRSSLILA